MGFRRLGLAGVVAGAVLAGGANAKAQGPGPIFYQTMPHPDQILQATPENPVILPPYAGQRLQRLIIPQIFDVNNLEPGIYTPIIEREKEQVCEVVGGLGNGFSLNLSRTGYQIPNNKQTTCWRFNRTGNYEIIVRGSGKCFRIGEAYFDAGDKLMPAGITYATTN